MVQSIINLIPEGLFWSSESREGGFFASQTKILVKSLQHA